MKNYLLTTPRLGLRNWLPADLGPFAEMNADPEVMRFFPAPLTQQGTVDLYHRLLDHHAKHGYCYFAVDRLDTYEFIGFIGLVNQTYEAPFCPCTDIGWRLRRSAWGHGFATEGAKACLEYAFDKLGKTEIYAVASAINQPSIRVMEKIGMQRMGTFDHPKLLDDERLRECVFYRKIF